MTKLSNGALATKLRQAENKLIQKEQELQLFRREVTRLQNNITGYQVRIEALRCAVTDNPNATLSELNDRAISFENWLLHGFQPEDKALSQSPSKSEEE